MKGRWFFYFGFLLFVVSKVSEYASRARAGDPPRWLSTWAEINRPNIALAVLFLSALVPLADLVRSEFQTRHAAKPFLKRLLDEYASRYFEKEAEKRNRLTIFKFTTGYAVLFYGIVGMRALKSRPYFRRLLQIRPGRKYLGVYTRSSEGRNAKSFAVMRASDQSDECEGMVGHTWENGSCCVVDLPHVTREDVRRVTDLSTLALDHPVRVYATVTRLDKNFTALKSVRNPARHFIGQLIRCPDGQKWGVVMLDSEDPHCPVLPGSNSPADVWLRECAAFAGKLVT